MTICIIDAQCQHFVRIPWQILPLNPTAYTIRIRSLNFDFELVPVACLRTDIKIQCESMSVELKPMHESIALKSVIGVGHRQLRKLKRIMSKSHQILLEVSDRTNTLVEVIHLRTTIVGNSDVSRNVMEPMIELQTITPPTHLYPTLPARRGSLQ